MRKTIITNAISPMKSPEHCWLDLEQLATVELTSEADGFPIESAFRASSEQGWRTADAGEQTVRLLFDTPQRVRHVRLEFCETEQSRTQEFVLRWSNDNGETFREVARQQYNFTPPDTTCENEEYEMGVDGITTLELVIVPDISGGSARASIAQFRVA